MVAETTRNDEKTLILLHTLNPDFICQVEAPDRHCATEPIFGEKGGEFVFPELYKPLQGRDQAHITCQVSDGSVHH